MFLNIGQLILKVWDDEMNIYQELLHQREKKNNKMYQESLNDVTRLTKMYNMEINDLKEKICNFESEKNDALKKFNLL